MPWKHVRLNFDVPPGWSRLDEMELLTFEPRKGLRLQLQPLSLPQHLDDVGDAQPVLGWAMERSRAQLGPASTQVFSCKFGLCASQRFTSEDGSPLQLWLLAGPCHALVVSLSGIANGEELGLVRRCVESMHLVSAAQFPN